MKKIVCLFACLLLSTGASATVITNDINQLLPTSGTLNVDLDGDTSNDLGLAEDCCTADNTWTAAGSFSTQVVLSWLSLGDVIEDPTVTCLSVDRSSVQTILQFKTLV